MTENEAIEQIRKQICNEKGVQRYCRDNCMHGIEHCAYSMSIQALEEIQQYRAIGTVDEFKALRENQSKCKDCAGCTNWKCDCWNERAKAIDDFTEKLMTEVESFVGEVNGIRADLLTLDYFCDFVEDTAEQMKGENNGQCKSS